MPTFVPFPEDPDPQLPQVHLLAMLQAAKRRATSPKARRHARPYADRACELLRELNLPLPLATED